MSLRRLLIQFWRHLRPRRRFQFGLLFGLMLISATLEIISLGAVIPFLAILTAPDRIYALPFVPQIAAALDVTSTDELVLPLTAAFIAAALFSGAMRILLLWMHNRLAFACGADLGAEVYQRTLYQPYSIHIARNSSAVISGIIDKVGSSVGILLALQTLISSFVLALAIVGALIAVDPYVASVALGAFGVSYSLVAWLFRQELYRNSQRVAKEQTEVIKVLQEGLGGIRDVLLDGTQRVYAAAYRRADVPLRRAQGANIFISQSPRYAMETLGVALIAALAYGISRQSGGITSALPTLGALAIGAQRLLPALQQGYAAWATMTGSHESLRETIDLLNQPLPADLQIPAPTPLHFRESMQFESARFRYASDGPWVLDGLDLAIPKGARVGLVGSTGCGKTTLLDLLMGLLSPTEGRLLVDGAPLDAQRVRAWQRTVAHVPQSIFLTDATVAENIALGVTRASIDMDRVRLAARHAQIADLIEARSEGYDTLVGERGVRLSGGQRQRIGIARALYKQASVLLFDEATSALDNVTEQSVMASIEQLDRDITIVIVAHRLTSVKRCDFIVELDAGRLVAQGTYEQMCESSASFRQMVQAAG